MASFSFADWPPTLTETQLNALTLNATTYALSHGLLYLPPTTTPPPFPNAAIHAPLSLIPSPLPRSIFNKALNLQRAYNVLYSRIAMDVAFLDRVMGADVGVGKVDDFVGNLWVGWKECRREGIAQPLHLGLFRSDYLLHAPSPSTPVTLKQVEFNTISSSFGTLSDRTAALHRYLLAETGYFGSSPHLKPENLPENRTTAGLAEGLAEAHKAYNKPESRILFVVQPGERNVFDQRWLEYELIEEHGIHVIRQTFDQLQTSASLDPTTQALLISPSPALSSNAPPIEISTIYFRAGYTPTDYPTPAHYTTRFTLEKSLAIKCPTIPLQLAGGKKVQEVLTRPGELEKFFGKEQGEDVKEMRDSWMGIWGLDDEAGFIKAQTDFQNLVLKPQREGGGNNVYHTFIPSFLQTLPRKEREAWIVMELISVPSSVQGYLVRAGAGNGAVRGEVVSELGIFGWSLFGGENGVMKEKEVGWLMRTKGKESDEGGVAAGFSVLDSLVLIDDPPSHSQVTL